MITLKDEHTADTSEHGLCRAFILAFILAQNSERAEHIVAAAIDTLPYNDFSETRLLASVAAVAWRSRTHGFTRCESIGVDLQIPAELQRVLELPTKLRYCFSLRVLAGMTVWTCAQLTSLRPEQIEYFLQLATRMLVVATGPRRASVAGDCPMAAMLHIDEDDNRGCGDVR